ncbi:MAG TPA: 3-hydroxyacyl-CoA dehydrogenase family protein [Afifellaceae bacterium]|nr:3-hydroxyacyl-CoA dehydrogenase family protein [Afifellaceae bacterium]
MSGAADERKAPRLARIGVIGAGTMGAGIALAAARAGMEVALIDREPAIAAAGKARAAASLKATVEQGRIATAAADAWLARLRPDADLAALSGVDLVIESVSEVRAAKAGVIARAAEIAGADAVLATNTSSLPITSLARHHPDPGRFIGMHFFAPAESTPLVEIVPGAATGERALATARAFAEATGKRAIVVKDCRGFYTSRLIGSYVGEGHLMLAEGVPAETIEAAAIAGGMALGPLALNDQVGLDVSWSIVAAARADLGQAAVDTDQTRVLEEMVLRQRRTGRKADSGFYDYKGTEPRLWPGLADLFPPRATDLEIGILRDRLLAAPALEAARLFQQEVVASVGDADIGSVVGVGFPAPGALSWIDATGPARFVHLCRDLTRRFGSRLKPNRQLVELAAAGETYRSRFPTARSQAPA